MDPLTIAALVLSLQQMGQGSKQQRLGQALATNPYYAQARVAPVWNLADIGMMLYGMKGGPKKTTTSALINKPLDIRRV